GVGDVEGKRCLSHTRATGQHDQVGTLQAASDSVEVDVTGCNARDLAFVRVDVVDLLVDVGENLRERLEVARHALARYLEKHALRLFEGIVRLVPLVETDR